MKTTVIIGATSAIGSACVDQLSGHLILVGRHAGRLKLVAEHTSCRGEKVETIVADLADKKSLKVLEEELAKHKIDQMILAAGILADESGDQDAWLESSLVNFSAQAYIARRVFDRMKEGHIVFLGSVAGDRGRQSNAFYGAQKSAIETFARGLAHRAMALGKNVNVSVVKPGFVRSPMTAHLPDSVLFSEPEMIAKDVQKTLHKGKSIVMYSPYWWRFIMMIVKLMPRCIFHRSKL